MVKPVRYGTDSGEWVRARQAGPGCVLPDDKFQKKNNLELRKCKAPTSTLQDKTLVTTTGVDASAGSRSAGLEIDQGYKASVADVAEMVSEEDDQLCDINQENKDADTKRVGGHQKRSAGTLDELLPPTNITSEDKHPDDVKEVRHHKILDEGSKRTHFGLCGRCLGGELGNQHQIRPKQALELWSFEGCSTAPELNKKCVGMDDGHAQQNQKRYHKEPTLPPKGKRIKLHQSFL